MLETNFNVATYIFWFQAKEDLTLPEFKGNLIRGALGSKWVHELCDHPKGDHTGCSYGQVFRGGFESFPNHLAGINTLPPWRLACLDERTFIPHGFSGFLPTHDTFVKVEITLFGKAHVAKSFVDFVVAAEAIKTIGPANSRGRISLRYITSWDPLLGEETLVYDSMDEIPFVGDPVVLNWEAVGNYAMELPTNSITFSFMTPTRVVDEGSLLKVPEFGKIFRSAMRRILAISEYHCGYVAADLDLKGLYEIADQVQIVENQTHWVDWWRTSHSQNTNMSLGGIVGLAQYQGDLTPLLPWLAYIPFVGLGKATTFGNGLVAIF